MGRFGVEVTLLTVTALGRDELDTDVDEDTVGGRGRVGSAWCRDDIGLGFVSGAGEDVRVAGLVVVPVDGWKGRAAPLNRDGPDGFG